MIVLIIFYLLNEIIPRNKEFLRALGKLDTISGSLVKISGLWEVARFVS